MSINHPSPWPCFVCDEIKAVDEMVLADVSGRGEQIEYACEHHTVILDGSRVLPHVTIIKPSDGFKD